MSSRVRQEDDRVWVEDVPRLAPWGGGRENTYMDSLSAAMETIEEDSPYDYLMGVSGLAFRLQIAQPMWCPSAPDAGSGFDAISVAWEAIGYSRFEVAVEVQKPEERERSRDAVIGSIDRGLPVIAMDLEDGMDWGVVSGYVQGGEVLLCRTKSNQSEKYLEAGKWPWLVHIVDRKRHAPAQERLLRESLSRAIDLAETESFDSYAAGFLAYELWIQQLRADEVLAQVPSELLEQLIQPNAWCYVSLADARAAASRYLGSIEPVFTGEAASHIASAAALYEKVTETLIFGKAYAPFPGQLEGKEWTREMRHSQADVLESALAIEREAVAALVRAVSVL